MLKPVSRSERGDTLVEVLLAMGVLSILITLSYAVMTRGFSLAQSSLDRTNTQALINGQASMLRAVHDMAIDGVNAAYWNEIKNKYVPTELTAPSPYASAPTEAGAVGKQVGDGCSSSFTNYNGWNFYFDLFRTDGISPYMPKPVSYNIASPSLRRIGAVPKAGDGLWIEAHTYRQTSTKKNNYVFYIKSCWVSPYTSQGSVTSQERTTVRLYDSTD